jgi:outer membrane protein OmpA-like peptidoglycan-associated protein
LHISAVSPLAKTLLLSSAKGEHFGPEYLTYVVWAITPEGRARNLGELQIKGDDGDVEVTTELQAFGLVVTAEPYFAVTMPSDVVVLENVVRDGPGGTIGNIEVINAKYELLKRGSYLMNDSVARFKARPIEPGSPLDLAEARNAVELARIAGADRFAAETFEKASDLLAQAEQARARRRTANTVMMPARQAVQTAEDARLIALQRQEEAKIAGILLVHRGLQVDVEGHTDSVGAEGYNQRLSEQRADSVRAYMIRQGIAPGAVATSGFGESQPVASNTTAAGRQQNRRVELVVTGEAIGRVR